MAIVKGASRRYPKTHFGLCLPLLALGGALSLTCAAIAQGQSAGEYELKAAYLLNFAKFVEWPQGSFTGPDDRIRLCVLGGNPFADSLEQMVRDKRIGSRNLNVEYPADARKARGCQILFISSVESESDWGLLRGGFGPGVLTVGESTAFAQAGGVIDFVQRENHVAFEINLEAADRAGLKISSKLLSLARIVHDDRSAGKP